MFSHGEGERVLPGFKKKTKHTQISLTPVDTTLIHEAYMLVRHLLHCYEAAPDDQELRVRLESLFGQVLPADVTINVLESLTRPYVPSPSVVDESVSPVVHVFSPEPGLSSDGVTISH